MNLRRAHGKCEKRDNIGDLYRCGTQMNHSLRMLFVVLAIFSVGQAARATADHAGPAPRHADVLTQLEKTDVVREGPAQSAHVLYVFFDANCLYCHLTWKALQ